MLRCCFSVSPLSNPEFIGRLQWSATAPANDRRAVAAGQGISDLNAALWAVEQFGARLWLRVGHKRKTLAQNHGILRIESRELSFLFN
ncbi:MAG: hypothetical protein DMG87_02190 [Acidobacteria bacterium]|nr:MAG: hypothetical protein DMG87_02190 [Acidobacteriota bacterium]